MNSEMEIKAQRHESKKAAHVVGECSGKDRLNDPIGTVHQIKSTVPLEWEHKQKGKPNFTLKRFFLFSITGITK